MTYVMSDIHGNRERFDSIMKQIEFSEEDTLYVLGDAIDRFTQGISIVKEIMTTTNIKMLLGNHEYMMLDAIGHCADAQEEKVRVNYKARNLWYKNGGKPTHIYLKHITKESRKKVFEYLRALPINIDIEVNGVKYKLVHGSPIENYMTKYEHADTYRNQEEFAVWERWSVGSPTPEDAILIFGHTPTYYFQPRISPFSIWKSEDGKAINIDCGSGYADGRLLCLRLDDMKEFYSEV